MSKESVQTKKVVKRLKVKHPKVEPPSDIKTFLLCVNSPKKHKDEKIVKICSKCEECKKRYKAVLIILKKP
jgi:hypothetical protein